VLKDGQFTNSTRKQCHAIRKAGVEIYAFVRSEPEYSTVLGTPLREADDDPAVVTMVGSLAVLDRQQEDLDLEMLDPNQRNPYSNNDMDTVSVASTSRQRNKSKPRKNVEN
jgi:hypothetical protein